MTSPSPLLYDTYYHIYHRGVNRENIFYEERNYAYFLKLYEKHVAPTIDTFAYCLLKNHFHLAVRVKAEDEIHKKTLKGLTENGEQLGQSKWEANLLSCPGRPCSSGSAVKRSICDFILTGCVMPTVNGLQRRISINK